MTAIELMWLFRRKTYDVSKPSFISSLQIAHVWEICPAEGDDMNTIWQRSAAAGCDSFPNRLHYNQDGIFWYCFFNTKFRGVFFPALHGLTEKTNPAGVIKKTFFLLNRLLWQTSGSRSVIDLQLSACTCDVLCSAPLSRSARHRRPSHKRLSQHVPERSPPMPGGGRPPQHDLRVAEKRRKRASHRVSDSSCVCETDLGSCFMYDSSGVNLHFKF